MGIGEDFGTFCGNLAVANRGLPWFLRNLRCSPSELDTHSTPSPYSPY